MLKSAVTQCHSQMPPWAQPLAWGGYSCFLSYLGFCFILFWCFLGFFFFLLLSYTCKSICILHLHTTCKWCDCHFLSCSIFVLCRMNTICTFSALLWGLCLPCFWENHHGWNREKCSRAFHKAMQWGLTAHNQTGVKNWRINVNYCNYPTLDSRG